MARTLGILAVLFLAASVTVGQTAAQSTRPRQKTPNNGLPPGEKIPGDPKPAEKPADADKEAEKDKIKAQPASPDDPPEEDDSLKPKVYDFNPLAAEKNMKAGDFYFKIKKNYTAAAARYVDASRYNPSLAEAFLKLGETYEKDHKPAEAIEAYRKYVDLAPDTKQAVALKKKLDSKPAKK